MTGDRIESLRRLADRKPGDPFTRYALALEYRRLGRNEEAVACFDHLFSRHPEYVPAYYHFGTLLTDLGQADRAREVFNRGLDAAARAGDGRAAAEIEAALDGM